MRNSQSTRNRIRVAQLLAFAMLVMAMLVLVSSSGQAATADAWQGADKAKQEESDSLDAGCGNAGPWANGAPVPGRIADYAFVGDSSNFYIIGGYNGANVSTVWKYNSISNTWTMLAPLPAATRRATAALYNGKIYVAGGITFTNYSDVLYIYNIATNSWSTGTNMLAARYSGAMGAYNGYLFVTGGFNSGNYYSDVQVYNIASNTWTFGTTAPNPIYEAGYQQIGQHLYIVGGHNASGSINVSKRLDMATGTWDIGPTWTPSRYNFGLATDGGRLYAMGGQGAGATGREVNELDLSSWPASEWTTSTNQLLTSRAGNNGGYYSTTRAGGEVWTFGGNSGGVYVPDALYRSGTCPPPSSIPVCYTPGLWTNGAPAPGRIADYAFVGDSSNFYIIGGYNGSNVSTVWKYNSISNTWTTLAPLPTSTRRATAALYNGKIYVAGGITFTNYSDVLYIYNIANNSWSTGTNMRAARYSGAMGAYNGYLFVAGGFNSGNYYSDVQVYNIASNTWTFGTTAPNPIYEAGYATIGQYLYIVGGHNASGSINVSKRLDMTTGTWDTGPAWTPSRYNFGLATDGARLYAMGGQGAGATGREVNELDITNWPSSSWNTSTRELPTGRAGNNGGYYSTARAGGEVWTFGGNSGGIYVPDALYRAGQTCISPIPYPTPSPSPSPTPDPATCPTGPIHTVQGDDTFTMHFETSCDISDAMQIGRYYGNTDASGHPRLSSLGLTVAPQALLRISLKGTGDPLTLHFAGLAAPITIRTRVGEQVATELIDATALFLPQEKGQGDNAPIAASNSISIVQNPSPGRGRAIIHEVQVWLRGMRPLVLAAGINSGADPEHEQEDTYGYFAPTLWDNVYPYNQFTYHPRRDGHDSIGPGRLPNGAYTPGGGYTLGTWVERAKKVFGVTRVNIVGHSMGGLWGRDYVANWDTNNSVDKLIMLGTPNAGSQWADLATRAYNQCDGDPDPACGVLRGMYERRMPMVAQLTTSFMEAYNRGRGGIRVFDVCYYDLPGERWDSRSGRSTLSDDVVKTESVKALGYSTHLLAVVLDDLPPFPLQSVHSQEPQRSSFQDALSPVYGMMANSYSAYCPARNTLSPDDAPASSHPMLWSGSVGLIQSGETQTTTVSIDTSNKATFAIGWMNPTSTLTLSLRDPMGQVLTPTNAYTGSVFAALPDGMQYIVSDPIPGLWQVVVSAESTLADGEAYYLGGEIVGGVQLQPAMSSTFTSIDSRVLLTTTVQDTGPITNAVVTVNAVLPYTNGYTETLFLSHRGSGVYTAVFTPTVAGSYAMAFSAVGTSHLGESFSRVSTLQLQVASGAVLTGGYAEEATDNSGDGLFDHLMITTTVMITQSGLYRVSGHLFTIGGQEIAGSTALYTVTTGTQDLPLSFDGGEISVSMADGPYQLRDLTFTQILSDELTVGSVPVAYTTNPYSRYSWSRASVVKWGEGSAAGVDTDGNGLYEWLQVSVPVDVREAGVYSASLNLAGPDGVVIVTTVADGLYYGQGYNEVVARFSGPAIRAAGLDGPYTMQDMVIWRGEESGSHIEGQIAQSEAYQSTSFEKGLVVHVTWQGRPSQPDMKQQLPFTMTLELGGNRYEYGPVSTDSSGFYTATIGSLVPGTYNWWIKGPQYLSNSGTVTLSGSALTQVEMGLMRVGDANDDNVVDITDFSLLRASFGESAGDPGYNANTDFNRDSTVDITDFSLLRANFGTSGAPPLQGANAQQDTSTKSDPGTAYLELRPQGKVPANGGSVKVGERFVLELWVNSGSHNNLVGQQSYLQFSSSMLQNVRATSTICEATPNITPDLLVFDTVLQNEVCNSPGGCAFRGLKVAPGSIAFASGAMGNPSAKGAFRVGEIGLCAVAPGQAKISWQLNAAIKNGSDTKLVDKEGEQSSDMKRFTDFIVDVADGKP